MFPVALKNCSYNSLPAELVDYIGFTSTFRNVVKRSIVNYSALNSFHRIILTIAARSIISFNGPVAGLPGTNAIHYAWESMGSARAEESRTLLRCVSRAVCNLVNALGLVDSPVSSIICRLDEIAQAVQDETVDALLTNLNFPENNPSVACLPDLMGLPDSASGAEKLVLIKQRCQAEGKSLILHSRNFSITVLSASDAKVLAVIAQGLEHLVLSHIYFENQRLPQELLGCVSLKSLEIIHSNLDPSSIVNILPYLPNLEFLNLNCYCAGRIDISESTNLPDNLFANHSRLRGIILRGALTATLPKAPTSLEYLCTTGCNISAQEMIEKLKPTGRPIHIHAGNEVQSALEAAGHVMCYFGDDGFAEADTLILGKPPTFKANRSPLLYSDFPSRFSGFCS